MSPVRPFEVRFESIGGLGADTASRALASAAVLKMGLDAAHLSWPWPERKGSATRSFVRLAREGPIVEGGACESADAIVVFHAALLGDPRTLAGLREDGTLIYCGAPKPVPEALARLPRRARAVRVDAWGIAAKEKCGPAAPILGALCAAFAFIDAPQVLEALCETLAEADEASLAANERAFARGAGEMQVSAEVGEAEGDLPPHPARSGDGATPAPGSSIWHDRTAARAGFLPVLNREQCIHCAMCEMVCPDFCLVWEKGEEGGRFERELLGVDYRYCKGCMRCVETCPASAMLRKAETPGLAERQRVPLFDFVE